MKRHCSVFYHKVYGLLPTPSEMREKSNFRIRTKIPRVILLRIAFWSSSLPTCQCSSVCLGVFHLPKNSGSTRTIWPDRPNVPITLCFYSSVSLSSVFSMFMRHGCTWNAHWETRLITKDVCFNISVTVVTYKCLKIEYKAMGNWTLI